MVKVVEHPLDYQVANASDLAQLDVSESHYGDLAHTPGYAQIWELGPGGWVEL